MVVGINDGCAISTGGGGSSRVNDECIFTGDAYIPGIKVVTSFPRSNKTQAAASETRIKELAKGKII